MRRLALVVMMIAVVASSGCALLVNGETRGERIFKMAEARNLRPENVKYFAPGTRTIIVEAPTGADVSVQDFRSSGYRYSW